MLVHKGFSLFSLGLAPGVVDLGVIVTVYCPVMYIIKHYDSETVKQHIHVIPIFSGGSNVCRGLSIRKCRVNLWCQTSVGSK